MPTSTPDPVPEQPAEPPGRPRGRDGTRTRPDPPGMRRTSLYITQEAADTLDAAVDQVLTALGEDTPRHVALSALLIAGARRAEDVTRSLAAQQATALAERVAALQRAAGH